MFSICALGTALAVRLPSKLDTSVARVAISASGIVTGGGGAAGLGVSAVFVSAAMAVTGGREQTATNAMMNAHTDNRSAPRSFLKSGAIPSRHEKTSFEARNQKHEDEKSDAGTMKI